jgi:hypothetical protein
MYAITSAIPVGDRFAGCGVYQMGEEVGLMLGQDGDEPVCS